MQIHSQKSSDIFIENGGQTPSFVKSMGLTIFVTADSNIPAVTPSSHTAIQGYIHHTNINLLCAGRRINVTIYRIQRRTSQRN